MNLSKNLNLSYAALEVQLNIRLEKTIQEKVGSNVLLVKFSDNSLAIGFLFEFHTLVSLDHDVFSTSHVFSRNFNNELGLT